MEGPLGSYRFYDPAPGIGDTAGSFPTPLIELENAAGRLLTLDSGGTVSLIDPSQSTSLFSYSAFGLDAAGGVMAWLAAQGWDCGAVTRSGSPPGSPASDMAPLAAISSRSLACHSAWGPERPNGVTET